jgi:hypothetical protein
MSGIKLISMLTWNDVTVENAKEVFLAAKNAPCDLWGFKLEGISTREKLMDLVKTMQDAGKQVFLEVLAIDEETDLRSAEIAAETNIDHLIGTVYYPSVVKALEGSKVRYAPFVGLDKKDTRLRGTVEAITAEAQKTEQLNGVQGINLSGFRYVSGDPEKLIRAIAGSIKKSLSIAGSVNSFERIDILRNIPNIWAFTIGGAFFEEKFGPNFAAQIQAVYNHINP